MITAPSHRGRLGLLLAALSVCCLPATALCDEFQYLTEDSQVVLSADLVTASKTKTFKEFLEMTKKANPKGEVDESVTKVISKLARVTVSAHMTDKGTEEIAVMTAIKPMTADEVKEMNASKSTNRKNHNFTMIKYGGTTIYQETYQFEFGFGDKKDLTPPLEGMTFFIDGKYIVTGHAHTTGPVAKKEGGKDAPVGEASIALLKKIIDRKKDATLSATMKAGLKQAKQSPVFLVVDLQALPPREQENLTGIFKGLPTGADIKASVAKTKALLVTLSEPAGKLKLSATLMCTDTAAAAAVKMVGERTLADIKVKAKEQKIPFSSPEIDKMVGDFRTLINAVQVTSAGSGVTATVEVDPAVAIGAASGWFFLLAADGPAPAPKVEKSPPPK